MSRLTKGVFGYETDHKKTPLNLINNQTRVNPIVYTAGWYNIKGERLGCGDLTMKDLTDISKKLQSTESFIVMTEADSIWNLPKELDRSAPGVDYIAKHMCWLVSPNTVVKISSEITTDKIEKHTKDGLSYIKAGRKAVSNILFKKTPPPKPPLDINNLTPEQLDVLKKQIAQIKLQMKTIPPGAPLPGLAKIPVPSGSKSIPLVTPKIVPKIPIPKTPIKKPKSP